MSTGAVGQKKLVVRTGRATSGKLTDTRSMIHVSTLRAEGEEKQALMLAYTSSSSSVFSPEDCACSRFGMLQFSGEM